MAGPQTALTWRKFPRDMISRPEIQFIAKRLAPEKRHTIFTVITALYCQADDFGYIDLDDPELFTDMCMLDSEAELFDLLERLVARKLVELAAPRFYKIIEWTEPYETIAPPPSAQASLRRRREQIAERIARARESGPGEPDPAPELQPPGKTDNNPQVTQEPQESQESNPIQDLARKASAPEIAENENDKKAENVTVENQIDKSTKKADVSKERERERERDKEKEKDIYTDTHTHRKRAQKKRAPPGWPDGNRGDSLHRESKQGAAQTSEIRTEQLACTEAREPGDAQTRPSNTDPPEDTEQHNPRGAWPEERTGPPDATDYESPGHGTDEETHIDPGEVTGAADDELLTKEYAYIPENAPAAGAWIGPFEALEKCFLREWPMGFPNEKLEREALIVLSARISMLGSKKNTSGVVACQFVGAFARLIKTGGYYEGMQFLPSMLLKPGNYAKVFAKVQSILHPKGDQGTSWAESWEKATEEAEKDAIVHDPKESSALLLAKYGISADDPDRYAKLFAARSREAIVT